MGGGGTARSIRKNTALGTTTFAKMHAGLPLDSVVSGRVRAEAKCCCYMYDVGAICAAAVR